MSEEMLLTAVRELRNVLLHGENCIGYPELAARLGVSIRACKRMVASRRIRPIISGQKTKRFHWLSVVAQLQK